jgi:hypothetical protein
MNDAFPDLPVLGALGEALALSFREAESAPARTPTLGERLRQRLTSRSRRTLLFATVALVVIGTGALAATNVIRIGAPVKPGAAFSHPHRGEGAIVPHSVRLLDVKTRDPIGEPPWGMRVLSTTRGVGCIQVGRLLDGRLGLLGTAGAFKNDGLFHAIPVNSSFSPVGCTTLDRNGRIFLAVHIDYMPASAAMASCYVARFLLFVRGRNPTPACKQADERTLDYGLLGPEAQSITYRTARGERTRPTIGPEGAYLLVRRGVQQGRSDAAGGNLLPAYGPITTITYRDGSICHLPAHGHPYPAAACKPHGYVPLATRVPTEAEVRAPVHARIERPRRPHLHGLIEVSFTVRVPVTSARGAYALTWHRGRQKRIYSMVQTNRDISAGQTIRRRLAALKPGTYYGSVTYTVSRGPDLEFPSDAIPRPKRLVGNFRVVVK